MWVSVLANDRWNDQMRLVCCWELSFFKVSHLVGFRSAMRFDRIWRENVRRGKQTRPKQIIGQSHPLNISLIFIHNYTHTYGWNRGRSAFCVAQHLTHFHPEWVLTAVFFWRISTVSFIESKHVPLSITFGSDPRRKHCGKSVYVFRVLLALCFYLCWIHFQHNHRNSSCKWFDPTLLL